MASKGATGGREREGEEMDGVGERGRRWGGGDWEREGRRVRFGTEIGRESKIRRKRDWEGE